MLTRGGAETQQVRLACRLKARGVDVRGIISLRPPTAFTDVLAEADIPVVSLDMARGIPDPRALLHAARVLRRWQPQIVVSFLFHANLLGRLAGRWAGIPGIISSIRNDQFGGRPRDLLLRLTDSLGHTTTTNSALVAQRLIRRGVVPPHRLRIIPNGLCVADYAPDREMRRRVRQELSIEDDTFLWIAAGRLTAQKDYPALLRAYAQLRRQGERTQLRIAGEGPLLPELSQSLYVLGLERPTPFLGLRNDFRQLLCAADGFVLSSAWEGLPNVVMEALASGVPVVATDVGGLRELVEPGTDGVLVPPHHPEELAAGMQYLMRLPADERKRMGERGRERMAAHYDIERVVDRWLALFNEVLGKSEARPVGSVP
jgi:glycosyltransferase involved in cell wall biosynthesis